MGCEYRLRLALAIGIVLMTIVSIQQVSAQKPSPIQCSIERQKGIALCKGVLFGQTPSGACCNFIRTGHYECACPFINAKLAALLDVNKASEGLRYCGRIVPRRFQCGSLYFP